MFVEGKRARLYLGSAVAAFLLLSPLSVRGDLYLGPGQLVQAGGVDITVPGYSVPSFAHWDGDNLPDLIVGEGSGTLTPKVRVYLNSGTATNPQFTGFFYAQSLGSDLTVPGSGCLGLFPRIVYWDADARKDLLIGRADGRIMIFLNTATDDAPSFDGGTFLQFGPAGSKTDIDVGSRATATAVDWNSDGMKDLVVGGLDGRIHIFINDGTDTAPDFLSEQFAQEDGANLYVPSNRSSPIVGDFNDDGRKDLLSGNTNGQLLLYPNVNTDAQPSFSGYSLIEADGTPIDLPGTPRSRPALCDWTGDEPLDIVIGAGDGGVHLYLGRCRADINEDGNTDISDLAELLGAYGSSTGDPDYNPAADLDGDGDIDLSDLASLLGAYGCSTLP